jgi:hypothetical protein
MAIRNLVGRTDAETEGTMMSGWMRLWVVITVVGIAWAAWGGMTSYQAQSLDADQAYMEAVAQAQRRDHCAHPPPASKPDSLDLDNCALFKLQALPEPLDIFVKHLAEQRDLSRSDALRDVALSSLLTAVLISAVAGLLFFAARWVAQGFQRH